MNWTGGDNCVSGIIATEELCDRGDSRKSQSSGWVSITRTSTDELDFFISLARRGISQDGGIMSSSSQNGILSGTLKGIALFPIDEKNSFFFMSYDIARRSEEASILENERPSFGLERLSGLYFLSGAGILEQRFNSLSLRVEEDGDKSGKI